MISPVFTGGNFLTIAIPIKAYPEILFNNTDAGNYSDDLGDIIVHSGVPINFTHGLTFVGATKESLSRERIELEDSEPSSLRARIEVIGPARQLENGSAIPIFGLPAQLHIVGDYDSMFGTSFVVRIKSLLDANETLAMNGRITLAKKYSLSRRLILFKSHEGHSQQKLTISRSDDKVIGKCKSEVTNDAFVVRQCAQPKDNPTEIEFEVEIDQDRVAGLSKSILKGSVQFNFDDGEKLTADLVVVD